MCSGVKIAAHLTLPGLRVIVRVAAVAFVVYFYKCQYRSFTEHWLLIKLSFI